MHRWDEMCVSVSVKSGWIKRASNSGSLPLSLTCRPAVMDVTVLFGPQRYRLRKKGRKQGRTEVR